MDIVSTRPSHPSYSHLVDRVLATETTGHRWSSAHARPWVVVWPSAAGLVVRLPQSLETLLLGLGVDVGADEETDDVEEGNPGLLGQELLREGERDGGGHPGYLHDGHEAGLPGRVDRVDVARAVDDGH